MSSARFVARRMLRSDVNEVLALHLLLFEVKYTRQTIKTFLAPDHLSLLLVRVDVPRELIVGVSTSIRAWASVCSRQRNAHLSTFGILPAFQRRGLGAYLFRLTCDILRTHYSVCEIRLHMLRAKQPTYDFYVAQRLVAVGVIKNYYTFDGGHHDAIVMANEIDCIPRLVPRADVNVAPELAELLETKQCVSPFAQLFATP
jgi:ribosomal protein S18 acetylase RimI-like enzyme